MFHLQYMDEKRPSARRDADHPGPSFRKIPNRQGMSPTGVSVRPVQKEACDGLITWSEVGIAQDAAAHAHRMHGFSGSAVPSIN